MPSYWIAHPVERAFISALHPEGIGQLLVMDRRWPAGRYPIHRHQTGGAQTGPDQRPWGHAVKDSEGAVRVEPGDDDATGD